MPHPFCVACGGWVRGSGFRWLRAVIFPDRNQRVDCPGVDCVDGHRDNPPSISPQTPNCNLRYSSVVYAPSLSNASIDRPTTARVRMGWTGFRRRTASATVAPAWPTMRRIATSRHTVVPVVLLVVVWLAIAQLNLEWSTASLVSIPGFGRSHKRMTSAHNTLPPLAKRVPCYGPRGRLLSESPDDDLEELELSIRTKRPRPRAQELTILLTRTTSQHTRYHSPARTKRWVST